MRIDLSSSAPWEYEVIDSPAYEKKISRFYHKKTGRCFNDMEDQVYDVPFELTEMQARWIVLSIQEGYNQGRTAGRKHMQSEIRKLIGVE